MPREALPKQQFKISLPPELAALIKFLGRDDPAQGMLIALDRLTFLDKTLLDDARMYLHREQAWAKIDANRAFEAARPLTEEEKRLKTIWDDLPEEPIPKLASFKNSQ